MPEKHCNWRKSKGKEKKGGHSKKMGCSTTRKNVKLVKAD